MASASRAAAMLVLPPCRRAAGTRTSSVVHELHLLARQHQTRLATGPSSRLFTSSARALRAPAPKPKKPASQPPSPSPSPSRASPSPSSTPASSSAAPATASVAPSRYAFIKSLATKQTPTLLYEAPSHFWFYFGCWTSGVSIVAWTALTGPSVVHQPEGVPQWVGVTFGASYVLLGAMGFYLLSKTPNIVSSIRVLPPPPTAAAAAAAGTQAAAAVGRSSGVAGRATAAVASASASASASAPAASASPQIEVTVKRMVPLLAPKVVIAPLDRVALKSRFSLPDEYVPELRRRHEDEMARRERERTWRFDKEHLLTMPFRRIGRAFGNMFRGVRAAWTDMGFGVITVDGKDYKVDVTKGFAHDGFRTLERIVTVGPK